MDVILRRLARNSLRRAMAGEHWAWFVLALAAFTLRRARRPSGEVVTVKMRRGERYLVSLSSPKAGGRGEAEAGTVAGADQAGSPLPAGAEHS